MKTTKLLFLCVALVFSACRDKSGLYDASGVFEATEVVVSSRSNGEIMSLDIEQGQRVTLDSALGYIDTTELYLKKVQLLAARKALVSRHTNVDNQVAPLEKQIETLKKERARFETLVNSDASTQKQVNDIVSQLEVAQRQLVAQKELLASSNNSISGERESIDVQIAQIDDKIKNSIIKSPINGTILSKYAQRGELATLGRVLFKVADIENMNLRVYITASQLSQLKIGQRVKVYSDKGESDRNEYLGTITWISDKAEFTPKTIQTRDERANLVYAIKVAVANDGYIKSGMYGEIKLQ